MDKADTKVPVGTTTVAGYAATLTGALAVLVAVVFKVDEEQALMIAGAVFAILSFAVTQVGRYLQARELAKGEAKKRVEEVVTSRLESQKTHPMDDAYYDLQEAVADIGRDLDGLRKERDAGNTVTVDTGTWTVPAEGGVPDAEWQPTKPFDNPPKPYQATDDEFQGEPQDDGHDYPPDGTAERTAQVIAPADVPEEERRDLHEIDEHLEAH